MSLSEQQPLRLSPAEVCEVIAAVCSETSSSNANVMTVSSRLNSHSGKPSTDVAVSVLIKLVIDMYVSIHLARTILHRYILLSCLMNEIRVMLILLCADNYKLFSWVSFSMKLCIYLLSACCSSVLTSSHVRL